uniref:Exocyst subunit Exo70 family protein n=1 Tax=Anthurium amnicola TaxID=1678845 RepID=A0A1D1ZKH1_9ARAE
MTSTGLESAAGHTFDKPLEPDSLFECLPNSLRPSSEVPGNQGDPNAKILSTTGHSEQQIKALETTVYKLPTLVPPRIVPLLHDLAQQMVQAGQQQQCFKIYREGRASVMEQTLRKLGVEKLSKDDVQKMQWEILEAKIANWIHFMRIAVKLLFAGEKKVCDEIFDGVDSLRDQCFAEVTANSIEMLLSFGDAIAKSKRSPEKLFVLLDMYEIMRELQSEIETIFEGKACSEMRESASSLTKRLAQTALETFGDFEEAVEKDATKTTVLDGTVHPLTSYVINYVKFLFDYQSTLKQLFQEFDGGSESGSQLANVTMQIMNALQTNLDGKSKQYKDPALTHIFLMNNIHYMVRSVRRSEAKDLLGDDWVQRHRRIVQQNANQYRRVAWSKILQSLTIQASNTSGSGGMGSDGGSTGTGGPGMGSSSGVSRALVKERFKSFNMQFEELHQRQSQWTVPDLELRESLRLSIAEVLLPAYRNFIKRFGPLIDGSKAPQKYNKYTPEGLDQLLSEFFEGKAWNESKR